LNIGVIAKDAHPPGREQLGHAGADAAKSDQPDGLAGEIVALPAAHVVRKTVELAPFAGAHIAIAFADLLEQCEHERDRGFGDREAVRFGRRVTHHDAKFGGRVGIDVIDPDRVLGDHAQPLRGLHDPPADRGVADRGAHQGDRIARSLHDGVFVMSARQLPFAISVHDLAAQAFERRNRLRWLLARRENKNLRLGHANSVVA
jgi:hypothetical protein